MKNRYLKKALAVMTGISLLAGGTVAIVPAEEGTAYEAVSSETSADAVSGEAAATETAATETAATETVAETTEAAATETAAETTEAAATETAAETTEAAADAATETTEAAAATEGAEAATGQPEAVDTYAAETTDPADHEAVYQVALLQSLAQGYFDGTVSVGELKQFGDTGIGTFDGLDGEMIVLDGTVYRAAADGTVSAVEDDVTVPFANITFFEEDGSITIENATDIQVLMGYLNEVVAANGKNLFYMVKVTGTFSDILVRSEPKQEKPYRLLDEALAADQVEYEYTDINGTLVGLFCPVYMKGLNSAGWHFHFVSDDLTKGGHVLQVNIASAQASYDITGNFRLFLPDNEEFQGINLGRDMDEVISNAATQSNGNVGNADAQEAAPEGEDAEAAAGTEAEDGNAEAPADAETEGGNAELTDAEGTEATDAEAPAEGAEATDVEAPAEGAEPAGTQITYTVQEGDNLYSIASQFNITPEELFGLNRQNIIDNANANGYYYETDEEYMEWIFLGQELVVGEEAPKAAEAAEGEAPAANAAADEQERNEGQSVKTEETSEAADAETGDAEAEEAKAGDAEAAETEAEAGDAEAEGIEAGDAEAEGTEAGDAEAEETEADDTEAETTEATTETEPAVEGGNKLTEIQERGVLLVGATGDYRPMSYYDSVADMYVGFDTELAKDLAESLDVDIEFVPTTWPTLLQDTIDGKFDIAITGITITDERKEQALMSDGYLGNGKTVLCRAEDAGKYTSIDAINQADVRVMENPGGLNEKFAEENLPNAQLTIHETNEEIPGLIAEGEADVMITEIMEAGYYAGQDERLAAPLIDEPFTQGELGALLPKDAGDLLQYVNAFFAMEKNNGRIDELANTYIYMTAEEDAEAAA